MAAQVHTQLTFSYTASVVQAGVRTLSVRYGTKQVFWLCISLLQMAYLGAIATGLLSKVSYLSIEIISNNSMFICWIQLLFYAGDHPFENILLLEGPS